MIVKTVTCKLRTNAETANALDATFEQFNAACNDLSNWVWERQSFRQFDIHAARYHVTRELFGLPAQLTVRAIAKVADSYKTDRSIKHAFGARSAVVFDARCFKLKGVSSAELTTVKGRKSYSLAHGGKQREQLLAGAIGEADLLFRDGNYYLAITVKSPDPESSDTSGGTLGIDLGIVELATDSEGQSFSGEQVKAVRRRVRQHRKDLQKAGTRSAFKRLQKVRARQSRFTRDVNHCISKTIVQKAISSRKALALEDLKGIRDRASGFSREMRWQMGNWAFNQLGQFIAYKAAAAGIPVVFVDPRNTSRTCSVCGHCDKANRKSQAHFKCLKCGFNVNADINAAVNIAARAELSTSLLFHSTVSWSEGQTPLLAAG